MADMGMMNQGVGLGTPGSNMNSNFGGFQTFSPVFGGPVFAGPLGFQPSHQGTGGGFDGNMTNATFTVPVVGAAAHNVFRGGCLWRGRRFLAFKKRVHEQYEVSRQRALMAAVGHALSDLTPEVLRLISIQQGDALRAARLAADHRLPTDGARSPTRGPGPGPGPG